MRPAIPPEQPYMDAPTCPGFQFLMAYRDRLHPYIRTFAAACAAVPDGIGWLAPNRFLALEVLRTFWALPATV
jgi:hypothetical protein